jgi:lipoprotein signal peptidase
MAIAFRRTNGGYTVELPTIAFGAIGDVIESSRGRVVDVSRIFLVQAFSS